MAAEDEPSAKVNVMHPLPFLEVTCQSSGKTRRFSAGTKAGFAVLLINRKSDAGIPLALHIEAVKEGEEPVSFGPDSVLVDYGKGWKLQTVNEVDNGGAEKEGEGVRLIPRPIATVPSTPNDLNATKETTKPGVTFLYVGKILLAFFLIFVLGGIFTLALENLPRLILLINSSM